MTKTDSTTIVPQSLRVDEKQSKADIAKIKSLLDYDPETGIFRWRVKRNQNSIAGSVAGSLINSGYTEIGVNRQRFLAHRLAILFTTGDFPPPYMDVDHINGETTDNRACNLRVVTRGTNLRNRRGADRDSESGIRGVRKNRKGWLVAHSINGKARYFGTWPKKEDAETASYQVMIHYGILGDRMTVPEGVPQGLPSPPGRRDNYNSTSGYRGVSFSKPKSKWSAYMNVNGKRVHIGYFDTAENAMKARSEAISKVSN